MSEADSLFDPTDIDRIAQLLGQIRSAPAAEVLEPPRPAHPAQAPEPSPAPADPGEVGGAAAAGGPEEVEGPDEFRLRFGQLSARQAFSLINWRRDPEQARRLREALWPQPPGEEGTVGEVLSGFSWDDDEDD